MTASPAPPVAGKPILIALTCDTDADAFDPSIGGQAKSAAPGWRGVAEGIPAMIEATEAVAGEFDLQPRFTWFVRVDNQIEHYHGSGSYLLDRFAGLWNGRRDAGDEIAWHPHIYRHDSDAWIREDDEERYLQAFRRAYGQFCAAERHPRSCRIGEAAFSNGIAAAIDELGIGRDATAMPGRQRRDADRILDWSITPRLPYRPSIADYRRPGGPSRGFLEIPMSMAMVKADYDREPFLRYVDLSFHPEALGPGLDDLLRDTPLLVTMTHPSGVVGAPAGRRHGLIAFSLDGYKANLRHILRTCRALGRAVEFTTIAECPEACGATAPRRHAV
jgi:hypothetical protein